MATEACIDGLRKYFSVTETPKAYTLSCNECNRGWRLARSENGSVHSGDVLALFNHAVGHKLKTPGRRKLAALVALNE